MGDEGSRVRLKGLGFRVESVDLELRVRVPGKHLAVRVHLRPWTAAERTRNT